MEFNYILIDIMLLEKNLHISKNNAMDDLNRMQLVNNLLSNQTINNKILKHTINNKILNITINYDPSQFYYIKQILKCL